MTKLERLATWVLIAAGVALGWWGMVQVVEAEL